MNTLRQKYKNIRQSKRLILTIWLVLFSVYYLIPLSFSSAFAQTETFAQTESTASLFIQPASGTVILGSTFTISVFVNTANRDVNAIDVKISFPPNKLQVVSPTAGRSIISVWVAQPIFSNTKGALRFQGGAPDPGINTNAGLISSIVFRARQPGPVTISIEDDSKVLLNDGFGTNILFKISSAQFNIVLPPPAGSVVVSPTHSDQTTWYKNKNPILEWSEEANLNGFSYILDKNPSTEPDNQSEGLATRVDFQDLNDGIWYFHLRALGISGPGPTTNFALMVDGTPPASFEPIVKPDKKTTDNTPIISFISTDAASGIDHYELKFIEIENPKNPELTPFFIEVTSPFQAPELMPGTYDLVVRAYDRAGNINDAVVRLEIINPLFKPISGEGLNVIGLSIPWWVFYLIADILIVVLALIIWKLLKEHQLVEVYLKNGLHWVEEELIHDVHWLQDKLKGRKHIHYDFKDKP